MQYVALTIWLVPGLYNDCDILVNCNIYILFCSVSCSVPCFSNDVYLALRAGKVEYPEESGDLVSLSECWSRVPVYDSSM